MFLRTKRKKIKVFAVKCYKWHLIDELGKWKRMVKTNEKIWFLRKYFTL